MPERGPHGNQGRARWTANDRTKRPRGSPEPNAEEVLMWRAVCRECDFTAPRLTWEEAATALEAHIHTTKHQSWFMVPVPDRPEQMEPGEECPAWRHGRVLGDI